MGLGYSEIVDYISRLNQQLNEEYGREAIYVVDSTGVGFAVLNYPQKQLGEYRIKGVSKTAGSETHYNPKPNEFYVPKQQLVASCRCCCKPVGYTY